MEKFGDSYINDKGVLSIDSRFFGGTFQLAGVKEIEGLLFFIYSDEQ